jgi:hypothetical protein
MGLRSGGVNVSLLELCRILGSGQVWREGRSRKLRNDQSLGDCDGTTNAKSTKPEERHKAQQSHNGERPSMSHAMRNRETCEIVRCGRTPKRTPPQENWG